MKSPELSIVIPVLNEKATLPGLLTALRGQREVDFEVIVSDGGSTDGTPAMVRQLAADNTCRLRLIAAEKGRGRQLNAGAQAAAAATLLFLHADSLPDDPLTLRRGLDALEAALSARGDDRVAGHFGLRFLRRDAAPSLAYLFYEVKARLDRAGCTHGDQGFLLRRSFFESVGPFDESMPVLEDTRLAEEVRKRGKWLLLPAEIRTSARRFEVEGLYERQLLNALIMNFAAIGWDAFFAAAPGIYRRQDRTGKLRIEPFLSAIRELLRPLPRRQRWRLWYATGTYVRANAWQLALAWDVRRGFGSDAGRGEFPTPTLERFDRWFDRLTDHPPGRLAAAALVRAWFALTWRRHRTGKSSGSPAP